MGLLHQNERGSGQLHFPFSNMASRAGRRNRRFAPGHAHSAGPANHRGQLRSRTRAAPGFRGIAEAILTPVAMPPLLVGGGRAVAEPPPPRPSPGPGPRVIPQRDRLSGGGESTRGERRTRGPEVGRVTGCPSSSAGDEYAATLAPARPRSLVRRDVSRRRPGPEGHLPPGPR